MSGSHHLKRLNTPRTLRLHRKEFIWAVRAAPGPHALKKSIPLGIIVRDYLSLCDTQNEAKKIKKTALVSPSTTSNQESYKIT